MILIDIVAELAGEQIAERNGDFVYLKTKAKVDKKLVEQAEALLEDRKTETLAKEARGERDRRLKYVLERIQRYQLQELAGCETDDSKAVFEQLLQLAQALRDVPDQAGFPQEVEWPNEAD